MVLGQVLGAAGGVAGGLLGGAAGGIAEGAGLGIDYEEDPYKIRKKHYQFKQAGQLKEEIRDFQEYLMAQGVPEIEAAQMATEQQLQMRERQEELIGALESRAAGEEPSLAEMQMEAGLERARAGAASVAASARGVSPALAARMAQRQQTAISQGGVREASMLRAQEQTAAQQALAQTLAGVRAQDVGVAKTQAQLQQQAALAQQQAALTTQAQKQQAWLGAQEQIGGIAKEQFAARRERAAAMQAKQEAKRTRKLAAQTAEAQARAQAVGAAASAAGAGLAAIPGSDIAMKENIDREGEPEKLDEFLEALDAMGYDYKNKNEGDGRFHGISAQSALDSEIGEDMVVESEDGLRIDAQKALMTSLAAQKRLHDRVRELEEMVGKKE